MNGFSETQHQLEERKQRIAAGTYGRRGSNGSTPAKPLEAAYLQLRHALLGSLLAQVTQACQMLQSANEQLTKGA